MGIDVGTAGLQALAVDPSSGSVVAAASREYALDAPRPGWAEQDAGDYERAALDALAELSSRLGRDAAAVRGIGLTGQMHTAVLLDERGAPVRPAMLWCDGRASATCRSIERLVGREGLARAVGNAALEGFTVPKLLWLREHEPAAFERTTCVLMPKDYVASRLTGSLGTDWSDASGTLAFDCRARRWSDSLLGALELARSLFPPAGASDEVAGELLPEIAGRIGLPAGIPVVRGAADNAASAVGLGVVRPGTAMLSIGTSGVILAPTASCIVDPRLVLHSFCHAARNQWYLMGVMLAAGGALRWYRDVACGLEASRAAASGRDTYDLIVADAEASPPGARGLFFLPYLHGERAPHPDALARGAWIGLSARTTKADLSRSVLEGIAFGLADCLRLVRTADGAPAVSELRAAGGGARSRTWRRLLADVLDATIVTVGTTEGAGYGAALLAGVGAGAFTGVEEAAESFARPTETIDPDPAGSRRYAELWEVYRALYPSIEPRFAALAAAEGG